jgi:hypothetical protein
MDHAVGDLVQLEVACDEGLPPVKAAPSGGTAPR